ncbi:MAG: imidazole glycerol phosphate synthase subunit HisH [Candidatus Omnitrophica bacterium]|nr:Imidazole glycerol phosphate synthase subunit HisH [bacterium]NUN98170.1 imidazole glycerol phosphate synthase subunit HisH [Candidatus Omnitrophota bacterium]
MIEIVDYGAGNLRSVLKGVEASGGEARLCDDPSRIAQADGVIFPGQGSFATASERLREQGFVEPLRRYLEADRPFLGICLGLQLLFEASEEAPGARGLGILKGANVRFAPGKKVPHMGWNTVDWRKESPFFRGMPEESFFYFVHSYFPAPEDPEVIAGLTDYEQTFCSAVQQGNFAAVQFHPEKSQQLGLRLLRNFIELCDRFD